MLLLLAALHLPHYNGGGDGGVQGFGLTGHGNDDLAVTGPEQFFAQAVTLAADEHSRRVQRYRTEVPGGIRQRRTSERQILFTAEGNERLRIHPDGRLSKHRAH